MEAMRRKGNELTKFLLGSSIQTTAKLKPGDSLTLGGASIVNERNTEDSKKLSAYRIVTTLVNSDAAKQKSAEQGDQPKSRWPCEFPIDNQPPRLGYLGRHLTQLRHEH